MQNQTVLTLLLDTIARLYPDELRARRVIATAGLDVKGFTLGIHAVPDWGTILVEAEKAGQIDALLDAILAEHGANQELRNACKNYRRQRGLEGDTLSQQAVPGEPPEPQASDEKAGRPKQLSQVGRGGVQGDVILADVGGGAQGVAVGKNIVQVGTLVIPLLPWLLGSFLFLGTTGVVSWLYFVPTKMSGLFNIAVAEFGEIDANGEVHRSESGKRLSEWVFKQLEQELQHLPKEFIVSIWHDSLGFTQKRVKIGVIPGRTPEERQRAAVALAKQIGANMLIYGNLNLSDNLASFVPEFYVSALRNHAEEITGRYELGTAIPLRLPFDITDPVSALSLNKELSIRTKVLALFTSGLLYELIADPTSALDLFRKAEQEFEDWSKGSGKEVLYLFIGRVSLFLKRDEEALQAFQQAIEINPNYARAYIGLGSYYYELAQRLPPEKRLETSDLDNALTNYQVALVMVSESLNPQLEIKATLGIGTVYRLKGEANLFRQEYETANSFFDLAIDGTQKAIMLVDENGHQHLALAFLNLGAAYQQKAYILSVKGEENEQKALLEGARDAYAMCIDHADAVPHEWFQNLKTKLCLPYKESAEKSLSDIASKSS